jgi:uncharacterized protein
MIKDTFKKIILESQENNPKYINRNFIAPSLLSQQNNFVLIGSRRSGKSYYFFEIKDNFIKKNNLTKTNFIHINFEDERLINISAKDLDLLLEAYREMFGEKKPILFLDEIQNIPHWEKFARRLADNKYKVYITGSNSKLLSKEIASTLGARYLKIVVNNFNFKEYLLINNFKYNLKTIFHSKERYFLKKHLKNYFEFGGFPEVAEKKNAFSKMELLKTYFDLYIYKDISTRQNIENPKHLILILKKIKENIGNEINPNLIYKKLLDLKVPVSVKTIYNYVSFLEDVFLISELSMYRKSFAKRESQKKYYFIDNGFLKLFEYDLDLGKKLENLVFTELKKQNKEIYYWKNKKGNECDFIIIDNNKATQLIQVTYELNEESSSREIKGLLEAKAYFNCNDLLIITYDQEKEIIVNDCKIKVISLDKWLLEN